MLHTYTTYNYVFTFTRKKQLICIKLIITYIVSSSNYGLVLQSSCYEYKCIYSYVLHNSLSTIGGNCHINSVVMLCNQMMHFNDINILKVMCMSKLTFFFNILAGSSFKETRHNVHFSSDFLYQS